MNDLFDIYVQQFKTTLAAQVAATLLPFRWTIGFPAELLLGRLTPSEALTGFVAQADSYSSRSWDWERRRQDG